jgi:hypothetical protein
LVLKQLKSDCKKQLESELLDSDVKTTMTVSDIKWWCNEFLRIEKNINETSISPSHKIERFEKLLKDVLSQ